MCAPLLIITEPDGTFPNHPADPLRPENLVDLLDLVHRTSPDLGVAFGDHVRRADSQFGDRVLRGFQVGRPLRDSVGRTAQVAWIVVRDLDLVDATQVNLRIGPSSSKNRVSGRCLFVMKRVQMIFMACTLPKDS